MSIDEMNETNVLTMTVEVWVCCLLGPVLSVAAAWQFGDLLFPGSSSDLLFLVLLLFWLPHGLGLPMVLFQNVVDPPSGRGLRRRVVSLSFVGVAAASLFVPLTF